MKITILKNNYNDDFFNLQNESGKNREVEIDIDELLDMDSDEHRRRFLQVCKYMLNNYYQNINCLFIILFSIRNY